jgi:putative cardiolipin synthase
VPVERLLATPGMSAADAEAAWRELHAYAAAADNFAPGVRAAIASAATAFPRLAREATWGRIDFLCDVPGKNGDGTWSGGGRSAEALGRLFASATDHVVIQSPYLVLSDRALELFRDARRRGVRIRVNTNSMASTDNLQAFAGYLNQKNTLLAMGVEIYEYRPDAATQSDARRRELVADLPAADNPSPVFGLHAKSMVVDSKVAFIGTFNLDPRSENLNTEVGAVLHDEGAARALEAAIEKDMAPGNSWKATDAAASRGVAATKRSQLLLWRMLPIRPLL